MSTRRAEGVVVFLGPSLPLAEARRLVRADFRPPAKQGDVFRALVDRPRVIALIDGLFEGQQPVWPQELRAALAAGVRVLGASSMGALRAAELAAEGLEPVGEIARRFTAGEWNDDAHVALLHAGPEEGHRPLTLPWVNAWATAEAARRRGVLTAKEAASLTRAAEHIFYQDRRWPRVLAAWRASGRAKARFTAWLPTHEVDLKARDARACLRRAARLARVTPRAPVAFHASSFVRRRRDADVHPQTLTALEQRPDAAALADAGLRTLLLAQLARGAGIAPPPDLVDRFARQLSTLRLAADEVVARAEVLALEALVLEHPQQFMPDGPARREGLALEAQRRGQWPGLHQGGAR